jgi:hypothetical protein
MYIVPIPPSHTNDQGIAAWGVTLSFSHYQAAPPPPLLLCRRRKDLSELWLRDLREIKIT